MDKLGKDVWCEFVGDGKPDGEREERIQIRTRKVFIQSMAEVNKFYCEKELQFHDNISWMAFHTESIFFINSKNLLFKFVMSFSPL